MARVAASVGYGSEAASSTAFTRVRAYRLMEGRLDPGEQSRFLIMFALLCARSFEVSLLPAKACTNTRYIYLSAKVPV